MSKRVNGTIFMKWARAVLADKSGSMASELTEADRAVIGQHIIPSAWYPFETYKHCLLAVFRTEASGSFETLHAWGKEYGKLILTEVYRSTIQPGNPMGSLRRFEVPFATFFDFGRLEVAPLGETKARITLHDFDPDFEPFYRLLSGWFESIAEMGGGHGVTAEIEAASWQGAEATSYLISWTR